MSTGKRLTNEEALERIKKKCDEKQIEFIAFDNDENTYVNNRTYLILKCNKCGNVWNTTSFDKLVTSNRGCPRCAKNKKLTIDEFKTNVNNICEEKDFTFIGINGEFNGVNTKLSLRCNKCGEEWNTTTYNNLRKTGRKTHTCGRKNPSSMSATLNVNKAIELINERLHNTSLEFVSFGDDGYVGRLKTKVLLKCKKCNEINEYSYRTCISPTLKCKNCETRKYSNELAISKIKEKCRLLDYTFLGFNNEENTYNGKKTYLILKCNKCGQIWKTTTFASFNQNIIKCPGCVNSWKMEKEVESYLKKNNIKYVKQCRSNILPWLKNKISLSLDFYLPDSKIAIECQGRQHFEPVLDFGGEKSFNESIERDKKKLILCKEHDITLLYYDSQNKHSEFLGEKVYNDESSLLGKIINNE